MSALARPASLTRAASLTAIADILARVAALGLSVLTARTLDPAEIGTLGIVVAWIAVISMIGSYVESGALVSPDIGNDAVRATTAGLLRFMVISVPLAAALIFEDAFLAPFLRDALRLSQGRSLFSILALLPVVEVVAGIPTVFLQRRLFLAQVASRQAWQAAVYAGAGTWMIVSGFGTIGLALAQVGGALCAMATLWIFALRNGFLPGRIDLAAFRLILRESLKQTTAGFVGFLTERLDNILVAGSLGPAALSFYSFAWNAARLPVYVISRVSRSAFLPSLALTQGRVTETSSILSRGLRTALALSIGLAVLVGLWGTEVITAVVGPKWTIAGACLEVMAVTIALSPLLFLPLAALQASGEAHKGGLLASSVSVVLQLALIPVMCQHFGERGAAIVDVIAFAATAIVVWAWTRHSGSPSLLDIALMLRAPVCGAATVIAVISLLGWTSPLGFVRLSTSVATGAGLYAFGFLVIGRGRLGD